MIDTDPRNSISGWYFTHEEISHSLDGKLMLNPSIDLSNPCNLNCPYCYIEEKSSTRKIRKPNEMSFEETLAILDDLKHCGARTINIVGAGEPTIDPHFKETIDYIHKQGMTTVLFTNGIVLHNDPALVRFLYERDVSVVIKINSFLPEIQDLVAGRAGYTEKRQQALGLLIDAGFASHEPTRMGADIIAFAGNLHEIPEIHEWCRRENIFPIAGEFIPAGRTESGRFQGYGSIEQFDLEARYKVERLLQPLSNIDRTWLQEELLKIDERFQIGRSENYAYFGGGICTQIIGLYIDIEGNIWPCVAKKKYQRDGLTCGLLGNIRAGDLPSKLWLEDSYMKRLRNSFDGGCPYKPGLKPLTVAQPSPTPERSLTHAT